MQLTLFLKFPTFISLFFMTEIVNGSFMSNFLGYETEKLKIPIQEHNMVSVYVF